MRVGLVTSNVDGIGGVETFNGMMKDILEYRGHTLDVYGKQSLPSVDSVAPVEIQVGDYFNGQNAVKPYDAVICNGEYGVAVNHPRAINVFHGNFAGYAGSVADLVSPELTKERLSKVPMQRESANGKYVVAVSQSCAQELRDLQGISVDAVIPLSVDTEIFRPIEGIKSTQSSLAVCRGRYFEKGFDILHDLASRGVKIDLYSDRELPFGNVVNHGFLDHDKLPTEYNSALVFVSPSRFEGGGLTTLEAMACGVPPLVTRTGYGKDLITDIPEFVADSMGEFFVKHFLITADRKRFGEQARELFWDNYSPDKFRRGWITLLENI